MSFPLHKRREERRKAQLEQSRQSSKGDWSQLRVSDRCDRCGSQAYVMVMFPLTGSRKVGALLFCGHHYAKHEAALTKIAVSIVDERFKLTR